MVAAPPSGKGCGRCTTLRREGCVCTTLSSKEVWQHYCVVRYVLACAGDSRRRRAAACAHLPSVHQLFHPMGGVRPRPAGKGGGGGEMGVMRVQWGWGRKAAALAIVQSESGADGGEEQETGKHVAL